MTGCGHRRTGSNAPAGIAAIVWRRLTGCRSCGDSGQAIVLILPLLLLLTLVPTVIMTGVINQLPLARADQDRQSALAAAQAGVDDYINRLDNNPNYYQYGATNTGGNSAFTGWVAVSPTSSEAYCYSANTTDYFTHGEIWLTVSGLSPYHASGATPGCPAQGGSAPTSSSAVVRTIQVELSENDFLDFLEVSVFNLVDPTLLPGMSQCATNYAYAGGETGACAALGNYWITNNVINGPVESDDDFYICGTPDFTSAVESADPATTSTHPPWTDPSNCADNPTTPKDQPPSRTNSVIFPTTDGALKSYAAAAQGGCLYTGPTSITLNSNGTMTVISPDSLSTGANCLGTSVPLPTDGVIFVQNMPTSGTNYSPQCPFSDTVAWTGNACTLGDAFVSGTLKGQLTISADDDIFITGNLTYATPVGTSVLGLITNNYIEINHPVNGTNNGQVTFSDTSIASTGGASPASGCAVFGAHCPSVTFPAVIGSVTVDAALLTLNHSLETANFTQGGVLGTLTITGAIAGRFMDIEGEFGNGGALIDGYNEVLNYDQRLTYLTPPHFLSPTDAAWRRILFEECPQAGCPAPS